MSMEQNFTRRCTKGGSFILDMTPEAAVSPYSETLINKYAGVFSLMLIYVGLYLKLLRIHTLQRRHSLQKRNIPSLYIVSALQQSTCIHLYRVLTSKYLLRCHTLAGTDRVQCVITCILQRHECYLVH